MRRTRLILFAKRETRGRVSNVARFWEGMGASQSRAVGGFLLFDGKIRAVRFLRLRGGRGNGVRFGGARQTVGGILLRNASFERAVTYGRVIHTAVAARIAAFAFQPHRRNSSRAAASNHTTDDRWWCVVRALRRMACVTGICPTVFCC